MHRGVAIECLQRPNSISDVLPFWEDCDHTSTSVDSHDLLARLLSKPKPREQSARHVLAGPTESEMLEIRSPVNIVDKRAVKPSGDTTPANHGAGVLGIRFISKPVIESCSPEECVEKRDSYVMERTLLFPPPFFKDKLSAFACMRPVGVEHLTINYNSHITRMLEALLADYEANVVENDQFRARNARNTLKFFQSLPFRISSVHDLEVLLSRLNPRAERFAGIGASTKRKLVELLTVGRVENLQYRMENELHKACKELVTLFGIGPIRARQLAQPPNCIHGIDDLKRRVADGSWKGLHYRGRAILEADSLLCLGYYDDLQERIPRDEVEEIIEFVHAAAERVYGKDNVTVTCCGSYRRGKSTSGDVDILVSTQASSGLPSSTCLPVQRLVTDLIACGFIVGSLRSDRDPHQPRARKATRMAMAEKMESKGSLLDQSIAVAQLHQEKRTAMPIDYRSVRWMAQKEYQHETFMGLCRLPAKAGAATPRKVRRIDIKTYPRCILPFATLYFTGSDFFNRSVRFYVNKCGWTLSDQGLRPALRENGQKVWDGLSVACFTEEDVFKAIGVPYRAPHQRDLAETVVEATPEDARKAMLTEREFEDNIELIIDDED